MPWPPLPRRGPELPMSAAGPSPSPRPSPSRRCCGRSPWAGRQPWRRAPAPARASGRSSLATALTSRP
eukprot:8540354-Alexandrium_andersonii.AAC.1